MNLIEKKAYSYDKAIKILTSQGKFHINLGLDRIIRLLELAGNPQDGLKVIHIAGTNGKGSTCAMLASILAEAGYKTGMYTSPHLIEYTERIKVNRQDISKDDFTRILFQLLELADKNNILVTEFELLTAMAFTHFKEQNVDYAVIETGLGGRLDATNVIKSPLASIITSIDFDHVDRLGDTIEKIASEKAGIIKEGVPVITLENNNGLETIKNIACKKNSILELASEDKTKNYELPLLGIWQMKNLAIVLKTVDVLNKLGISISDKLVKSGLKKVSWPGRFQYFKDKNLIIDGAHNFSAAKLLRESLDIYFPNQRRVWIYGSLNTKDYSSVIQVLFRPEDIIICTKFTSNNSVAPEILKEKIISQNNSQKIYTCDHVNDSINIIYSYAEDNYIGIIAGSLYLAGEALAVLSN